MLPASLGRDIHHIPFKELKHGLLHPLSGNIPRDGRVVALAGDLVNLVYEDYSSFGQCHIIVSFLQKPCQDTLDIFSDISGLCEDRGIHNGERYIQQLGYSLGH